MNHVVSAGIAEVYKLESNENLRLMVDSMQMPTVEYKEINMEDYSKYTIQQKAHSNWTCFGGWYIMG